MNLNEDYSDIADFVLEFPETNQQLFESLSCSAKILSGSLAEYIRLNNEQLMQNLSDCLLELSALIASMSVVKSTTEPEKSFTTDKLESFCEEWITLCCDDASSQKQTVLSEFQAMSPLQKILFVCNLVSVIVSVISSFVPASEPSATQITNITNNIYIVSGDGCPQHETDQKIVDYELRKIEPK